MARTTASDIQPTKVDAYKVILLNDEHFSNRGFLFEELNRLNFSSQKYRIRLEHIENIDLGLFQYLIALKLEHGNNLFLELKSNKEGHDLMKHAGLLRFFDETN